MAFNTDRMAVDLKPVQTFNHHHSAVISVRLHRVAFDDNHVPLNLKPRHLTAKLLTTCVVKPLNCNTVKISGHYTPPTPGEFFSASKPGLYDDGTRTRVFTFVVLTEPELNATCNQGL